MMGVYTGAFQLAITNQYIHMRRNFTVNVVDGAFFGLGLGLASYVTVIPLFIASLTDSTILIGMIATVHMVGWQLPQMFTAGMVSRRTVYKPLVLLMTIHERWPFLALGLLALTALSLATEVVLVLAFIIICIQAFGGGFTATAWQSMIGKIIPDMRRGTFYGMQSMAANLMASVGSVIAGVLLVTLEYPTNFAAVFILAACAMVISYGFLYATREPPHEIENHKPNMKPMRSRDAFWRVLREDSNFCWFIVIRALSQFAAMAIAFYTIFAVRRFGMDEQTVGVLTGVLLLSQTVFSPIVGWAGDRWGHRTMFALGNIAIGLSALIAITATDPVWMYAVFILVGIYNNTQWTSILALTVQFGSVEDRPYYIGISNSLTGPATLIAPLVGGWLADASGFNVTFSITIAAAILCFVLTLFVLREPGTLKHKVTFVAPNANAAD